MKIEYLYMENFRNFFGSENKIHFSSNGNNVTVIHGGNGAGKSTILNAFTWTLYDSFTPSFSYPEVIVNKRAIAEAEPGEDISASVEIKFSHDDKTYVVTKTKTVKRIESDTLEWEDVGNPSVEMQWQSGDGNWKNAQISADEVINRVLPKDLHNYFFFDGERMEKMVRETKAQKQEIQNAAKKLSGLEIMDRAIHHLQTAAKTFERELGDSNNKEFSNLIHRKTKIEQQQKAKNDRNLEIDKEIKSTENIIHELEKKLTKNRETKELQQRREKISSHKSQNLVPKLKNIDKRIKSFISLYGFSFFINDLLSICDKKVETMREKRELPTGIKRQFVDDLLTEQKCICTTPLMEGSIERQEVVSWREKAGLEDVELRAINISASIKLMNTSIQKNSEELKHLKDEKGIIKNAISLIEDELVGISEKLENSTIEAISALEERRTKLIFKIEDWTLEFNRNDGVIKHHESEITDIDQSIQQIQTGQRRIELAKKRLGAAKEASTVLNQMLVIWQSSFKDSLQGKMQEVYKTITNTPYKPIISEDFGLRLVEETTGTPLDVGGSTGESQVLSVTFILSIIEEVRKHVAHNLNKLPGPDVSSYPVVMDSPFGQLAGKFRAGVATRLSLVADQAVLMVSGTQWKEHVENALEGKVGKSYYLTYHNPVGEEEVDVINGQRVKLIVPSDQYEWSSIRELDNA